MKTGFNNFVYSSFKMAGPHKSTLLKYSLYFLKPRTFFRSQKNTQYLFSQVAGTTQYFWYRSTLAISENINTPESFNWKIGLSLIVAWCLVYVCMIKGIASSGKVVYVTATFPYIVLIIFFFRGVTLKGMSDGLRHLFTPKVKYINNRLISKLTKIKVPCCFPSSNPRSGLGLHLKLKLTLFSFQWYTITDPVVWLEAGTQIFFSLGLAFGGLIAFSSYNPVNNNCYKDALVVSLTNCLTSMFAGIVVFSILGFKATMVYEHCLEDRNRTLHRLFGNSKMFDGVKLPLPGSLVPVSFKNGSILNISMPELPVCDLEKELDNVSKLLCTTSCHDFRLNYSIYRTSRLRDYIKIWRYLKEKSFLFSLLNSYYY